MAQEAQGAKVPAAPREADRDALESDRRLACVAQAQIHPRARLALHHAHLELDGSEPLATGAEGPLDPGSGDAACRIDWGSLGEAHPETDRVHAARLFVGGSGGSGHERGSITGRCDGRSSIRPAGSNGSWPLD